MERAHPGGREGRLVADELELRIDEPGVPRLAQPLCGMERIMAVADEGGRLVDDAKEWLDGVAELVVAGRIAEHVPPHRQVSAASQQRERLGQCDLGVEPMEGAGRARPSGIYACSSSMRVVTPVAKIVRVASIEA